MKKTVLFFLLAGLIVTLSACGSGDSPEPSSSLSDASMDTTSSVFSDESVDLLPDVSTPDNSQTSGVGSNTSTTKDNTTVIADGNGTTANSAMNGTTSTSKASTSADSTTTTDEDVEQTTSSKTTRTFYGAIYG